MRLSQVARKLNIGKNTIIDFLSSKGYQVEDNPNHKINEEQLSLLSREFADSAHDKEEASAMSIGSKHVENVVIDSTSDKTGASDDEEEEILIKSTRIENAETKQPTEKKKVQEEVSGEETNKEEEAISSPRLQGIKVVGKIDLNPKKKEAPEAVKPTKEEPAKEEPKEQPAEEKEKEVEKPEAQSKPEPTEAPAEAPAATPVQEPPQAEAEVKNEVIEAKAEQLKGLKVLGKIELPKEKPKKEQPVASSDERDKEKRRKKRPRKRLRTDSPTPPASTTTSANTRQNKDRKPPRPKKEELTDKEIQEQIKATLAKLSGGGGKGGQVSRSKYRREKRSAMAQTRERQMQEEEESSKILKLNEFISVNDLASMMSVSANEVISVCMSLGMFVSINQRLDAEAITIIADEFGYNVEFANEEEDLDVEEEVDTEEELLDRAPIVTIMGHVDHGKTSLLDFIRKSNVMEDEAGGITQHIGAYDVMTSSGKRVAFLDTPGHEAFTAMRARGAKITDIVVVVIAADDAVMPQTKEAINHAQVAGVPIVFALNKVDKPNANPDKIREELANMNILVEEWGGKYQCQEISAKSGQGVEDLLEKVLLEAEVLELKANPNKNAAGTVVEAELDKGRGYVATVLVQSGTLHVGDVLLAGAHYGRVKAMFDHRGNKVEAAVPSTPVLVLGLDGAPQAGDKLNAMESEREAREIATKRAQLLREQSFRTKKHITLDEIGRRLAIGSFKELNVIVKGDVDGSVEALGDSLLKLSTEEVQVSIIHKAVGQISESDVLLASASDAIIIGFQVRPSAAARRLAEQEEIEIRHYSVIYDAINEIHDAMEGMLTPDVEETVTANVEVREVFKVSKVGTVAGCMVTDGTIKRNNKIRLVRDGIVVFSGEIGALKRFKDDVSEVRNGFECGISIKNYNDIKLGDVIEAYETKEVKRTL